MFRAAALSTLAITAPFATAQMFLDLDPGTASFSEPGQFVSDGRSVYFTANETFTIESIGFLADLKSNRFEVVVHQGLGVQAAAGATLASASQFYSGTGYQWNDIPIDFQFVAGNDYIVNFRASNGANLFAEGSIMYYQYNLSPVDIGPVTMQDGREGYQPNNFANSYTPFMRLGVPTPSTAAVMGLAGACAVRRRR